MVGRVAEEPEAAEPAAVREAGELAGVAAEEVVGRVEEQAAVAVVRAEGLEGARAVGEPVAVERAAAA